MESRKEKIFRLFKHEKSYQDLADMFNFSKERARQIIAQQIEKDILKRLNFSFYDLSLEERNLLDFAIKEEIAEIIEKRKR